LNIALDGHPTACDARVAAGYISIISFSTQSSGSVSEISTVSRSSVID
jgi:hypothetical protein